MADAQRIDGLVQLGGREVRVTDGGGTGPPVVLLAGCGVPSPVWDGVIRLLPGVRAVRLDRPGMLGTPWSGRLPTLAEECRTLADLLARLGAPVVLVAHSMAGLHAEALAREHPELVAGLVLVDGSVEWDAKSARPARRRLGLARLVARLPTVGPAGGLVGRGAVAFASHQGWRGPGADAFAGVYRHHGSVAAVIAENAAYAAQIADLDALRERRPWPARPGFVLTATGDGGADWSASQHRLADLLGHRQIVVDDSRHLMMLDRPDVIAEAVRSLTEERP